MMKIAKIKSFSATILVVVFGLTSCSDFFDVSPDNAIKESDFYRNKEDLNAGAFGMYESLSQEAHKLLLWGDARADMVTTGQKDPDPYINEFVMNNISSTNPYTNYAGIYRTIARCNRQMEKVYDVMKLDETIADRDAGAFYGEALLLRSLCYYYLVRTFDKFPVILSDYAEEITYISETGDTISEPTLHLTSDQIRGLYHMPQDKQEVWTLIYNDVLTAMGVLPLNYKWNGYNLSSKERYGRISQPVASTLAAEIALWLGEYQSASSFCDICIKNNNHSLGTSGTWPTQFTSSYASPHSMFLLGYQYDKSFQTNKLQEFTSSVRANGGKYYLKPVSSIVDEIFKDDISSKDSDIRSTFSYKVIEGDTVIWKYIGLDNVSSMRPAFQSDASWMLVRSADVYLLKAIADLRLNNYASAFNFVNMIRAARGLEILDKTVFNYTNTELMDSIIFTERAREFAFEGKRWYDLMFRSTLNGENVLAKTVARKYPADQRSAVFARLQDEKNWYVPVDPKLWE
ncbi:RagB/SusD family nutrient uptake outer membrane protein [Gaoshiqia sp. Z1-71]|uniref:RagB/SusD family nutrient uptake outer membrane protein n=1 Tax=Gaoshiqia hydrogeniformans TaxID=3290090 RepID=UPI003BF87E97